MHTSYAGSARTACTCVFLINRYMILHYSLIQPVKNHVQCTAMYASSVALHQYTGYLPPQAIGQGSCLRGSSRGSWIVPGLAPVAFSVQRVATLLLGLGLGLTDSQTQSSSWGTKGSPLVPFLGHVETVR